MAIVAGVWLAADAGPERSGLRRSGDAGPERSGLRTADVGPNFSSAIQPSSFAAYTETIPGTTVSFEMVPIPGGTFVMGSPAKEAGRKADEGPVHDVKIEPFWMGKFEVTWDEYDHFAFSTDVPKPPSAEADSRRSGEAAKADAVTRPTPPYGDESFGFGKGRQPALNMAHHGAMEYTRWLSQVTGRKYRLATEAEWEYAARAGSPAAYTFGDDAKALGEYAWFAGNSEEHPHPVGQKKPNKFGLHDMHGNVAEWCVDQYKPDVYKTFALQKPAVRPVVVPGPARFPHAARGGSWADAAKELRSAARRGSDEDWSRKDPQSPRSIWWHTEGLFIGFRVVRAVEEQPELVNIRSKITRDSPDR
jgi:formylglycine-generating enzyme required for sulfatase activity